MGEGKLSDRNYLMERVIQQCPPYTPQEEKTAFGLLKKLKHEYKHRVMLEGAAKKEVREANRTYQQGKYPHIAPFEYRKRTELNGTLERLEQIISGRAYADRLAELPFSQYYLDHLCAIHPRISQASETERTEYWKQAAGIAQHNVRLVYSIANRFSSDTQSLLELMPAGMMGLYNAIDKFRLEQNTKFSSMAVGWIQQSIKRDGIDQGIIRKPAYLRAVWAQLSRIAQANPEFSQEEIEEEFEKRHGDLRKYYKEASRKIVPLDAEEGMLRKDITETTDLAGMLDKKEKAKLLYEALDKLDDRDRTIMILRYGLNGGRGMMLKETGKVVGLTRERIRQIERDTLRKLAAYISLEPQHL